MRKAIKQIIQQHRSTYSWMSTQEAVDMIKDAGMRMTIATLIKLVHRGEIEGKKVGKRFFVSRQSIESLVRVRSN